jgi:dihydrodipicolinate synthase/N-acetylneuraminate lyase
MEVATSLAIFKNPQFVGLKESCGDVNQLKELAINTPLRIFAGDDKLLLQTMNYGGVGAIRPLPT